MASTAADPSSAANAPWHGDAHALATALVHSSHHRVRTLSATGYLLGNATEPLLYVTYALLAFCLLSGKWWLMAYVLATLVLFGVVLMYAVYLEYNAQAELERRYKEQARFKQRWGQRT